ncbi:MAG TPA: peptidoglycan-associated lipoprotein Pal [Alphaproteobacteria bacterium]|nr:peptidoglycan-associated lipoprotein Pal [Rhodospirillaceae bacterium]HRJ11885.1 peptidoglycan-associated lipoprotein Pal [Alphaproteobacteria bacterium]
MRKSWLVLLAAVFLVTACESTPDSTADASANAGGGTTTTAPNFSFDPNAGGAGINQLSQDVADRVFFGYDSSELTAEGRTALERQAEWLKTRPNLNATIEGHCDERGTREYNLALGERRAAAAKNYLVSLGVPAAQLSTISYGKERPAVEGSDEAAWAQNRRAVTVVQ